MVTGASRYGRTIESPAGLAHIPDPPHAVQAVFTCHECATAFYDGPPLIVVSSAAGLLAFCSESCTREAGYDNAVYARQDAEAEGIVTPFTWMVVDEATP